MEREEEEAVAVAGGPVRQPTPAIRTKQRKERRERDDDVAPNNQPTNP
jgi:hypothetical protein